jgi:hypothetical protein
MTKWIAAAIFFAILGAMFVIGAFMSASAVHDYGVQLISGPSRRSGFTTADRTGSMAFAALISGLGCLGSVFAAVRARRRMEDADDDDLSKNLDSDAWTCPHCHERNPGNFEDCWKCQRVRTKDSA